MSTRSSAFEPFVGSEEERAAAALVVRGERDELEDPLDVSLLEAGLGRVARRPPSRTRPWAHGHALIPVASTPTTRRVAVRDAAAIPISVTSSCVRSAGHGRQPLDGVARRDLHFGAKRLLALDDVARDVLGEVLDEELLVDHDLVDRLLEDLGEARHVHALLGRVEVDEAVDLGRDERVAAAVLHAHRLLHAGDPGAGEADANLGLGSLQIGSGRLVSPAARVNRTKGGNGRRRTLRADRLASAPMTSRRRSPRCTASRRRSPRPTSKSRRRATSR